MASNQSTENEDYLDLLRDIDQMASGVSDKEADFIESVLGREPMLSQKQREWIDDMAWRYLGVLGREPMLSQKQREWIDDMAWRYLGA